MKNKRAAMIGGAILAIAVFALFVSNHAILVWSSTEEERGPDTLVCRYFTGAGFVKKQYLRGSVFGREACPRWISLAER